MRTILQCVAICWLIVLAGCATQQAGKKDGKFQYVETDTGRWLIHDMNRPAPAVITPGTDSTSSSAGKAPSDAIVLFDGTDLSGWTSRDGSPAKWTIRDGYMESVKGSGPVKTEGEFGSCHLHVEFATPSTVEGSGQGRGNSGVFLMANYEVQILDSYDNITYPESSFLPPVSWSNRTNATSTFVTGMSVCTLSSRAKTTTISIRKPPTITNSSTRTKIIGRASGSSIRLLSSVTHIGSF